MTCSIIKKSELERSNRLDAEYYQLDYLALFQKINKFKSQRLSTVADVLRGNTPKEYNDYQIPIIRSGDLSDFFINENLLKAKKEDVFYLKNRDVLISSIGFGSIGKVDIFTGEDNKFGTVSEVTVLRTNNIDPFYTWAFLRGKFGQFQINREITGATGQLHLNTGNVKNILVPTIDDKNVIKKIYEEAEISYKNSQAFYSQAENLLLEELGLKDFSEKAELWSIVQFSEARKVGRIDAEYFQPKYEKLISKIKNKSPQTLETFIKTHSTGFPFQSENYQETGIPLIRINNIQKGYLDLSNSAYLSEKDYLLSPKDIAKSGDVILSMSGSIGMTALVPKDIPKSIINQRILRITPQNIEKDYLVLLLNSIVGSYQLERIGTGGLQTNISYKDIKNILIPILPKLTQQKISELVQKSHESRKKAKELLEEAKHKVEKLIEKGV